MPSLTARAPVAQYGGCYVTSNITGVLLGPLVVSLLVIMSRHFSLVNVGPAAPISLPVSRRGSPEPRG